MFFCAKLLFCCTQLRFVQLSNKAYDDDDDDGTNSILIHPAVWPQYTNVTERQTGQTGQRSRSIRPIFVDRVSWALLVTVAQK